MIADGGTDAADLVTAWTRFQTWLFSFGNWGKRCLVAEDLHDRAVSDWLTFLLPHDYRHATLWTRNRSTNQAVGRLDSVTISTTYDLRPHGRLPFWQCVSLVSIVYSSTADGYSNDYGTNLFQRVTDPIRRI